MCVEYDSCKQLLSVYFLFEMKQLKARMVFVQTRRSLFLRFEENLVKQSLTRRCSN